MPLKSDYPAIAIIGMACRFPQAESPEAFWNLLTQGIPVFRDMPRERSCRHALNGLKTTRGGFLESPYLFDNQYFKISEEAATYMDPQQRIMLEIAATCMLDAGYPTLSNQKAGVFLGANQMAHEEMLTSRWYRSKGLDFIQSLPAFQQLKDSDREALARELTQLQQSNPLPEHALVGNLTNMVASRISHELNLKGPSLTVDTACSSSLVAVHLACESLHRGDCDIAFSGGVNLNLSPSIFRYMQAAGVISPTEKCIPFSEESDGILLGEGAGMVLLKRLDEALRDGDNIQAVIRASGINNDGHSLGIMAPAWKGQLALLEDTYRRAGYDPGRIGALEAHGTSTRIGDSVELSVIERFFPRPPENALWIGSVKSNIGHTLGAAGIAGLIKMVLALQKKELPPSLHASVLKKIGAPPSGIRLPDHPVVWNTDHMQAAGVSAFGFGGTNAHVVLEPAPAHTPARAPLALQFNRRMFYFDFFPQLKQESGPFYQIEWQARAGTLPKNTDLPDRWIVVGEASRLKTWISKNHETEWVTVTNCADTTFTRVSETSFQLDAAHPDHLRWLLESVNKEENLGLVWLGHADMTGLTGYRHLLQAVNPPGKIRLWTITFQAFPAGKTLQPNPFQRALAALAWTALSETPPAQGALIDIDDSNPDWAVEAGQLTRSQAGAPVIWREGQIFHPELVSLPAGTLAAALKSDGVYLLLGGSSGIGALLAAEICRRPVQKVIVAGRRKEAVFPENIPVHDLPEYHVCDVRNVAAMTSLVRKVYKRFGRLDGVFLMAGAFHYGSLASMPEQPFMDILDAKIAGAQNLKSALSGIKTDFVYLMSSISSLCPAWSKGMGAYAAANAFLDSFALGEPGWKSCSWGIWEQTGMALARPGAGFDPAEGVKSLVLSLDYPEKHIVAMVNGQAETFSWKFPAQPQSPGFRMPKTAPSPAIIESKTKIQEHADLRSLFRQFVAEAILQKESEIDDTTSFYQLGMDSLSAVEVVSKIEKATGLSLDPTLLFEYDTIDTLHGCILERLATPKSTKQPELQAPATLATVSLLPAQQSFYVQQTFYPESPCNMMVTLESVRRFNPSLLEISWGRILRQHDALRMKVHMSDQGPVQSAGASPPVLINLLTFQDRAQFTRWEDEAVNEVFDLASPPLFRLYYAELPGGSALSLVMHHLVADAWSLNLLLHQLLSSYLAAELGEPDNQHILIPEFRQYVRYFEEQLRYKNPDEERAYWSEALQQLPPPLPGLFRANGAQKGYRVWTSNLDNTAMQQLKEDAARWNVTPFQVLLAACFLALKKSADQDDLIVRVAVANRERGFPEVEHLTGCLADTLPLRVNMKEIHSLENTVLSIKQKMLEALRRQGLSAQEYASLPIKREGEGSLVLSPVGMSLIPVDKLAKEKKLGLTALRCRSALGFTDLSLICTQFQDRLDFAWNYDSARMEESDLKRLNGIFLGILCRKESASTGRDPLILPQTRLFPEHISLHEKVWEACDLYGERTAVVNGDTRVSYQELKKAGFQVANRLCQLTPPNRDPIGIFGYPGATTYAGITGIAGAGKPFIPFDPDWPDGRIVSMLRHSGLKTMLVGSAFLSRFEQNADLMQALDHLVLLDDARPDEGKITSVLSAPDDQLLPEVLKAEPESIAYIMYTSGTSGQPKGVMVSHAAVSVFLDWVSETFQVDENTRFIHTSSLGFGGSIRQLFSTLLGGGVIFPIPRIELKDPESLYYFLKKHHITHLNTVPTVLNNLAEQAGQFTPRSSVALPDLKWVLVGGEALYAHTVNKWYAAFGNAATVVNLYGSTETIVNATMQITVPGELPPSGIIPLGRQKPGSVVRLINESGEICQPGETGELLVGGPCLATGYFKAPELTAEKFIALDNLGEYGGFYRTGDLARMDEKGCYHFLGRNDDQVQIYGNRVEVVEIEEVLYRSGAVQQAAVVEIRVDETQWLAAFLTKTSRGTNWTPAHFKQFLTEHLPAYMLPHIILILDHLPINQAGKTDRNALRRQLKDLVAEPKTAPHAMTPAEKKVAAVWGQVLHTSPESADDDFFLMGGDSILVLEMLHHLKKVFPVIPKAVAVFRNRTVKTLAQELESLNTQVEEAMNLPVPSIINPVAIPLSPAQKGFILLRELNPDSAPNAVVMLAMHGNLKELVLKQAFNFLLVRHDMLRATFEGKGVQTRLVVGEYTEAPFELQDISHLPFEKQQLALDQAFDALKKQHFGLSEFPLFRIRIFRLSADQSVFLACIHHIVGDAWSLQILFNDLLQAYDALDAGNVTELPAPPPPYASVIAYWSGIARAKNPAAGAFWESYLAGLPALPAPSEPVAGNEQSVASWSLNAEKKDRIIEWGRAQGATLFNTLFTIFSRAIGQYRHFNDFLIGTAVSGRDLPIEDVEQIIGCFARNLPLRVRPGPDFKSDLFQHRQDFVGALEHQEISPQELFRFLAASGQGSIYAINRFFFSFMDFTGMKREKAQHLEINWDQSRYFFNSGNAGSELMLGISVSEGIHFNLHGYAPLTEKLRVKSLMEKILELVLRDEHERRVETALIAYLPGGSWLDHLLPPAVKKVMVRQARQAWLAGGDARLVEILYTPIGSSGLILLPYDADEIRQLRPLELKNEIARAIKLAGEKGASYVSLAGILPSLTNYGFSVLPELAGDNHSILTTGHACTVVAVVKTLEKTLACLDLEIGNLNIAVVGCGSIGQASTLLALHVLGMPKSILAVDIEKQLPAIQKQLEMWQLKWPELQIRMAAANDKELPPAVYEADLLIGASAVGNILDVKKLKPGAIVLDDSFPPIADTKAAIDRMTNSKDVLIAGAGKLDTGTQQRKLCLPGNFPESFVQELLQLSDETGMPGCRLEPLALMLQKQLKPTIGLVTPDQALQYWRALTALGVKPVPLHCGKYVLPKTLLETLKNSFFSNHR